MQLHVRAAADRLFRRRRICISSLAETSAVMISMDEILCLPLKSTHSASSTPWRPTKEGPCGLSGGVTTLWTGN